MNGRFYLAYCAAVMLVLLFVAQAVGVGQATVQLGTFHLATPSQSPVVTHSIGN